MRCRKIVMAFVSVVVVHLNLKCDANAGFGIASRLGVGSPDTSTLAIFGYKRKAARR